MRCEVVAIGTELLLGQIVDTNSSFIGERLAEAGIDSHYQVKVGDNQSRIVGAIKLALDRADAVICCGGLGPTQDDITRESIAEVMGVGLERDEEMVAHIRQMFASRGREMSINNARQGDRPIGAAFIDNPRGTAPGLICPIGIGKVIYAVPGVPHEMVGMVDDVIIPDLMRRSGSTATIVSRTLRTWGTAESTVAEMVGARLEALEDRGNPTIAFLASGIEGIKVRVTAKAADKHQAGLLLDDEERELRAILGDLVFGVDDENMEVAVSKLLTARNLTLAVAESVTGGLVSSRLVSVPGAHTWFRGGIVSYATEVKHDLLDVPDGPVVSEAAAIAMAVGVAKRCGADVGLSITGVAGPDTQDGQPVGTVFFGLALGGGDGPTESGRVAYPGDRERIRQFSTISALDLLRRRLAK